MKSVVAAACVTALRRAVASHQPSLCVSDALLLSAVSAAKAGTPGDLQFSGVLPVAKELGIGPHRLAEDVASRIRSTSDSGDAVCNAEVSGEGFVNITLCDSWLAREVSHLARDEWTTLLSRIHHGGMRHSPQRVLVDFASPNVGKVLHVGHLRSSVIGDTLSRLLEARGDIVTRVSHVGDIGVPVACIVAHILSSESGKTSSGRTAMELGDVYRAAKARLAGEGGQRETAFGDDVARVGRELQKGRASGNTAVFEVWDGVCAASRVAFDAVWKRLRVLAEERGESTYVDDLASVVADLLAAGLAVVSQGAVVVPLLDEGSPPVIVRKRDGTYLYATTDLAAVRRRVREGHKRVVYVTDASQASHFRGVFEVARRAGWVPQGVQLEHVGFGIVTGPDGKKLSSRRGIEVTLDALLCEAVEKARTAVATDGARTVFTDAEVGRVAEAVGTSAVRYFELAHSRFKNYEFSFEQALALRGNTSVYLEYVIARLRGVRERLSGAGDPLWVGALAPSCSNPHAPGFAYSTRQERELACELCSVSDAVAGARDTLSPHVLCEHLHMIARRFHAFYEACPVQVEASLNVQPRVELCAATDRVLRHCLDLIGVEPTERL